MENSHILELLEKYKSGTCSVEEIILLENWYGDLADGKELEVIAEQSREGILLRDEMWQEFQSRLDLQQKPVRQRKLWPWLAATATLLISLSAGLYFYSSHVHSPAAEMEVEVELEAIEPGSNKAILTLSDGAEIELDQAANGKLATQSGSKVIKLAEGELSYTHAGQGTVDPKKMVYNTISTPKGGQYIVILPDGTKVWLNAASSLRYPTRFAGSTRQVTLTGEGYFEVAKNRQMPFKVTTKTQEVTVLGTHFNINSYEDEQSVKTTLLEGSVQVSQANYHVIIKPGQQAETTAEEKNRVVESDTREAIAWKNGLFSFKRADIRSVMRQISRWYNVDVEYRGQVPDSRFTGKIYRNVNISQVLQSIGYLGLKFKIEGRKIIITT